MKVRTLMVAAAALIAASTQAFAQDNTTVRDILNRAQTESDRRAVDDLIGRLRGAPPPDAQKAAPGQAPATSPGAAAPAVTVAPQAPPPGAQLPTAISTSPVAPAATVTSAPGTIAPPPAVTVPTVPSAPGVAAGGSGGPQTRPSVRPDPQPAAAPDASVTPTSAPPIGPPGVGFGTNAGVTAPVGRPIGPAAVFPAAKPSGTSDEVMARAPDIAKDKGLPSVDLEVLFDYDKAVVTPAAAENLMTLGRALIDPRLAGAKFVIAGHTDTKGNTAYNLALSQRRSEAVRAFLVEHFKLSPADLIARGFGESRPKNARNPQGPENRRVQVINWTSEVVGTAPAAQPGPPRRR